MVYTNRSGKPERIGILGSAFNPPHRGHSDLAERAERALQLDRVILVPTGQAPHKAASSVSPELRSKMARCIAKGRKRWTVSDMELRRSGMSYTKDTIRALRSRYPKARLFWIAGADSFASMSEWNGGLRIFDRCTLVVGARRGHPVRRFFAYRTQNIIQLPGPMVNVSSTDIRDRLAQGADVRALIEPRVLRFIRRHHLYS